jgi:hypothetical protein
MMPRLFAGCATPIAAAMLLFLFAAGLSGVQAQVRPLAVAPLHTVESGSDGNRYFSVSNTGTDARLLIWVSGQTLPDLGDRTALVDPLLVVERLDCGDADDPLTCTVLETYQNDDWQAGATQAPPESGRLAEQDITQVLDALLSSSLGNQDSALLLTLPTGPYRARIQAKEGVSPGLAELNVYEFLSDADYAPLPGINGAYLSGLLDGAGNIFAGQFAFVEPRPEGWVYQWTETDRVDPSLLSALQLPSALNALPAARTGLVPEGGELAHEFTVANTGTDARILLWAAGPSLASALEGEGAGGIVDPALDLYYCGDQANSGCINTLLVQNDDFAEQTVADAENYQGQLFSDEELTATLQQVFGSNGLQDKESALLVTLPPGRYRVVARHAVASAAPGLAYIGLLEFGADARMEATTGIMDIFDLNIGTLEEPQFWNVSLRPIGADQYLLTHAEDLALADDTEEDTGPNLDAQDAATWATCHAVDDLTQGPVYTPGADSLIADNDPVSKCVGKVKIIEASRAFDVASCSSNPFTNVLRCAYTGSFNGDEVYAIRMRISDLDGRVAVQVGVDTELAFSDHAFMVFAASDTPGKFDVEPECRPSVARRKSSVSLTTDENLTQYGFCIVPENTVYYLNVRFADYQIVNNQTRKASDCGARDALGNYSYRCDTTIQFNSPRNDFAFDRVAVPQGTFTAAEGQWVHIPVELLGGLDGDAAVDFHVFGVVGADDSDFSVQEGVYDIGDDGAHRLSWSYADHAQRTKYISLYIPADGSAESAEILMVRIRPVNVYLDDGAGTYGTAMSSGEYLVQISIAANGT